MIQVRVGENQVVVIPFFFDQAVSETPDSRTRIHNNDFIIPGADLDTGGVSPVFNVFRS